jgi:hypothetical protein
MSRLAAISLCVVVLVATSAGPAFAYIGPGAGITMLGALWGVIVAVALAIGAVLFWPIRALLRHRKAGTPSAPGSAPVAPPAARTAGLRDEAH